MSNSYSITYGNGHDLTGFTNIDYIADKETRRLVGVYIYILYGRVIS